MSILRRWGSRRGRPPVFLRAVLVLTASWMLVLAAGCHSHIPLAEDEAGYAPPLAPPVARQTPGTGTSVGYLAPDFKLVDLAGREVKLSDYRGRPVLLNFWTYCTLCKEELPYIQTVYDDRAALVPDLVILAVNVSQPADQVKEFVAHYGFTFEFLIDTWATAASDYYINEIPTTFFIGSNGIIQDVHVGLLKGPEAIKQRVALLEDH